MDRWISFSRDRPTFLPPPSKQIRELLKATRPRARAKDRHDPNVMFSTVASSGTGGHHPGTPGGGAVFPGTIQGSIGDFSGTGLVFPWATNARGKPRRGMMRRAVFSDLQRRGLEKRFQLQKYISKPDRKKLAEKLGLKDSQVSRYAR